MPRKPKNVEKTTTDLSLDDEVDTPLVVIALEHEITRARQFARATKDPKKKFFHQTVERTYREILTVIQEAQ